MQKKRGKKTILWIVVAFVLVILAVAAVRLYPMLLMNPTATGQVADTAVISIKNGRNAVYFLETGDGMIAVDAGTNAAELEKSMAQLSIAPSDVRHVLLTHSDSDHIAGLRLFTDAQFYISEDELQMLDGSTRRDSFGFNTLPDGFETDRFVVLSDKQEWMIGNLSIHSIKTPGHTPGSMSFFVDQKYFFTGDATRVDNNGLSLHPFSMDTALSRETFTLMAPYINECAYVFTAHYGHYSAENLNTEGK